VLAELTGGAASGRGLDHPDDQAAGKRAKLRKVVPTGRLSGERIDPGVQPASRRNAGISGFKGQQLVERADQPEPARRLLVVEGWFTLRSGAQREPLRCRLGNRREAGREGRD